MILLNLMSSLASVIAAPVICAVSYSVPPVFSVAFDSVNVLTPIFVISVSCNSHVQSFSFRWLQDFLNSPNLFL